MKNVWKAAIYLFLPLAALTHSTSVFALQQPGSSDIQNEIDAVVNQRFKEDAPGGAVLVMRNGQIIYERYYGLAQPEYGIAISDATMFPIASVSKQFTAFAIANLVKGGKLSLDDDIRKYLPYMPDFGDVITIDHLLHHTSGLRDHVMLTRMAGWRMGDVMTQDQVLRLLSRQQTLNFRPGDEYEYSNSGYLLLAEIVEAATEKSFSEWMQENVFSPLNMEQTRVHDEYRMMTPQRAYSFGKPSDGTVWVHKGLNADTVGSTGITATARDLAKWLAFLLSRQFEDEDIWSFMTAPGLLNDGSTVMEFGRPYAAGLVIEEFRDHQMIGHDGSDAGYRSAVKIIPDTKTILISLSNSSRLPSLSRILNAVHPQERAAPKSEPAPKNDDGGGDGAQTAAFDLVGEDFMKKMAGAYRVKRDRNRANMPAYAGFEFILEGEELQVLYNGSELGALQQIGATKFRVGWSGLVLEIPGIANDPPLWDAYILSGSQRLALERSNCGDGGNVDDLLGTYWSKELGSAFQIEWRDDALYAVNARLEPTRLVCVSDEDYFIAHDEAPPQTGATGFTDVEILRTKKRSVHGAMFSFQSRARRVLFEKMD